MAIEDMVLVGYGRLRFFVESGLVMTWVSSERPR